MNTRSHRRKPNGLRPWKFQFDIAPNALGSVLASCGKTEVICAVSVLESVPKWMKDQKVSGGWITAEYSMLPYSTLARKERDITKGRIDGRSQEIQRLIGRSIRAVVDLEKLGPRTLAVDCDVLCADGGTRTTAITGTWLALQMAVNRLIKRKLITRTPIKSQLAATSVGIVNGIPLLDLDYEEDRDASVDMNVVMTSGGRFVELQAAGEESTFSPKELATLTALARVGIRRLFDLQNKALRTGLLK